MKKVILLTGASSGIGYQTAESLAKEGHVVYGAARRIEKMETLKDRVIEALENVIDPELGIDIMNLGLVYDVKMSDDNKHAIVDMTLTSMGCPLAPVIIEQVETAMLGVDEIEKVDVNIVWEPAWTKDRMSRYAKIALGVIDYE